MEVLKLIFPDNLIHNYRNLGYLITRLKEDVLLQYFDLAYLERENYSEKQWLTIAVESFIIKFCLEIWLKKFKYFFRIVSYPFETVKYT